MAKRAELKPEEAADLFKKTEQPAPKRSEDPIVTKTIGIKTSEMDKVKAIAAELKVTPHAVIVYALRDFLRRWEAGERPKTKTKTTLEL